MAWRSQMGKGVIMYKYFVKADHPILRRIDEFVEAGDLEKFVADLTAAGYENISIDTIIR